MGTDTIAKIIATTLFILVLLVFVFGMWHLGRKVHYYLSYEKMVISTLCESVKAESLTIDCES